MLSLYFLIGAMAGMMSGLFGIGGGVVIIPSLAAIFLKQADIPNESVMHIAVATSLATVVATATSAIIAHHKKKSILWNFTKRMAPFLIMGSLIGTTVARYMPSSSLKILFGCFLIFIGLQILLQKNPLSADKIKRVGKTFFYTTSTFVGFLSSVLGVGGGVLMVPFLMRCGLDMRQAAGTSIAGALIIGITASICFMLGNQSTVHIPWSTGYLYWPAFFGIAAASIIFAPIGTMLAHKFPKEILKKVFAIFLLMMACDMLFFTR